VSVRAASVCAAVLMLFVAGMPAQEREDRTLLTNEQMRAIINEASGERAMHHLLEFRILLGMKKTPLEVRDFLSGEFEPVPLRDVMAVLKAREASGQIKLIPKSASVPVKKKE
jgi:hypothetical protein